MKALVVIAALLPALVSAAENPATNLRRQFEQCAWTSLMITPQRGADANYSAELAMSACHTEEQALGLYLSSVVPPHQADTMLVSLKLRLKRDLVRTAKGLQ